MKKISNSIHEATSSFIASEESRRKILRANQVKELWKDAIIKIYGTGAEYILSSVNAVYILSEKDSKKLIIYSNDSLVRDSLINMREFILHEFGDRGEHIEEYRVLASKFGMRDRHPYKKEFFPELERLEQEKYKKEIRRLQLTEHQRKRIEETSQSIEDPEIKASFREAMTACLKSQNY